MHALNIIADSTACTRHHCSARYSNGYSMNGLFRLLFFASSKSDWCLDLQHGPKFSLCDIKSIHIRAINNKNYGIRVWVVTPPIGSDARLATKIPHLELNIFILQGLNVKSDCRNGGRHVFAWTFQTVYTVARQVNSRANQSRRFKMHDTHRGTRKIP